MAQLQNKLNSLKSDINNKISEVSEQFQEAFKEDRGAIVSTLEAKAVITDGNFAHLTNKVDAVQSTVDAIFHDCSQHTENSEKVLKDVKETERLVGKTVKALETCNSSLALAEITNYETREDVKKILKIVESLDGKYANITGNMESLTKKYESLEGLIKVYQFPCANSLSLMNSGSNCLYQNLSASITYNCYDLN